MWETEWDDRHYGDVEDEEFDNEREPDDTVRHHNTLTINEWLHRKGTQ